MYDNLTIKNILTNNAGIETTFDPESVVYFYRTLWMPTEASLPEELEDWDGFVNEVYMIWENLEDDPDYYSGCHKDYLKSLNTLMEKLNEAFEEI